MTEVSVIIPGIRTDRWINLYNSIGLSTKRDFELIICGPYYPPMEMHRLRNFKFISDYGSPARAQSIASEFATGKYITWGADDAIFIPEALDFLIDLMEKNTLLDGIMCKYLEGANGTYKVTQPNSYFALNGSTWTNSSHFHNDFPLFNAGILKLDAFKKLGGWDCSYEVAFYSYADMAARACINKTPIGFSEIMLLDCDHSPGESNDHKPIHDAQTYSDVGIFKSRYGGNLSIIDPKSWKDSPKVWTRRFN